MARLRVKRSRGVGATGALAVLILPVACVPSVRPESAPVVAEDNAAARATLGHGAEDPGRPTNAGARDSERLADAYDVVPEVHGEVLAFRIVQRASPMEPVPGGTAPRVRSSRPSSGAPVIMDLGSALKVVRDDALEPDGAPLDLRRTVLRGKTDDQGRVEFTLTGVPAVAIPKDGRSFTLTIDDVPQSIRLRTEDGMALWRAVAGNPRSRWALEAPVESKMLLDRADAALGDDADRGNLEDADRALQGFETVQEDVLLYAPYAARPDQMDRASGLRERLAARTAQIEAEGRRAADETPEARRQRLQARREKQEAKFRSTLQSIKQQGQMAPPALCVRGQVALRPFRADGGWAFGPKACADDAGAALAIYESGCDQGSLVDCYHLGLAYEHGHGTTRNARKAGALYSKACAGGWPAACAREGILGDGSSLDRACDEGDAEACLWAGLGSERAFRLTTAVAGATGRSDPFRDPDRGSQTPAPDDSSRTYPAGIGELARFEQYSCLRSDANGCTGLAFMLQNALASEQDLAGAARLYAKACNAGLPHACSRLGNLYGLVGDFDYEAKVQAASCEAGAGWGCTVLAVLYTQGLGVPKDEVRARALYARGCDLDDDVACREVGR